MLPRWQCSPRGSLLKATVPCGCDRLCSLIGSYERFLFCRPETPLRVLSSRRFFSAGSGTDNFSTVDIVTVLLSNRRVAIGSS